MIRGKILYFVILAGLGLQGCGSDSNSSEKFKLSGATWYDYGNGLINLSNISKITSSAEITGEVMPREYYENKKSANEYYGRLSAEQKAIVDAHADYCFDNLRVNELNERYGFSWPAFRHNASLGAFNTGQARKDLAEQISNLKTFITPEFAQICVIELKGDASISFDEFNVSLDPYNKFLKFDKNKEGQFVKSEIDASFDEMVGDLQEGITPWNGIYTSLIDK